MPNATMTIMVGCQGSGKSTWANANRANRPNVTYCSADSYFQVGSIYKFDVSKLGRAHGRCFRNAVEAVIRGESVVIDNTNGSIAELAPYYALGQAFGLEIEVVRMVCSPDVAAARNVHGVPEAGVRATARKIESLRLPPFWAVREITVDSN